MGREFAPSGVRDDRVDGVPVVVFLHLLFFEGSMFDVLVHRLGGAVRSVRPDFRGQGTGEPSDGPLTMDRLADDIVELIDRRIEGKVHLVGSSMGAYVAVRVAARRPDLVVSCTLLGCTSGREARPEHFRPLIDGLRAGEPAALVDRLEHTMFGDDYLGRPLVEPTRTRWRRHLAGLPASSADAAEAMFARPGMQGDLATLRIPLLLIAGAQDHAKRPEDMAAIAAQRPGSRLVVLPGVGHTPIIEDPETVADELLQWWRLGPSLNLPNK